MNYATRMTQLANASKEAFVQEILKEIEVLAKDGKYSLRHPGAKYHIDKELPYVLRRLREEGFQVWETLKNQPNDPHGQFMKEYIIVIEWGNYTFPIEPYTP